MHAHALRHHPYRARLGSLRGPTLPVAGIIYPLWSLIPRIYQGHMQRRVYRMYGELKLLELELRNAAPETRECAISRPRSARAMTRFIDRFQ